MTSIGAIATVTPLHIFTDKTSAFLRKKSSNLARETGFLKSSTPVTKTGFLVYMVFKKPTYSRHPSVTWLLKNMQTPPVPEKPLFVKI